MKIWTMPRIEIEAFSANEYVAVCMSSGSGTFTLECDNKEVHNVDHNQYQYQDTGHYCYLSISLPNGAFSSGSYWWYDSDGNHAEGMKGASYPTYGTYDGKGDFTADWVYHFEKVGNEIVWRVYQKRGSTYTSADGWHVSYISGNPAS